MLLISLPKPYLKQPDSQAPLGLMSLAAMLDRHGIPVELKDYSIWDTKTAVEDLPGAEIFGITVVSMELLEANRFAKLIKEKYPTSKVVLGGPGTYTDEYVDWNYVDSIVKGEGDLTVLDIVKDVGLNKLRKKYAGKIVRNLDTLPIPARHYLDNLGGNVFAYNKNYIGEGSTVILTSRGCPFKCAFCAVPSFTYSKMVRFRNPKAVRVEMQEVIDCYGIKQFRFSDDMFTARKSHVLGVCDSIGDLGIAWRISCRVKPLDMEMLQAMKDAGLKELSFGVESFDDKVLKLLNKKATVADNVRALEMVEKAGLKSRILLMNRVPGQTSETIRLNKEYLDRVPHTIVACTSFVPTPGSDIWTNPARYGVDILDRNLDNYNFYTFGPEGENELKPLIKLHGRSLEEFQQESLEFREWLNQREDYNRG